MSDSPADTDCAPSPIHRRLAAIMAVAFLLSWLGLVPVAWQAYRDYRTANSYVETSCEILQYLPIRSGDYNRPGKKREISIRPSFVFRFDTLEGETVTTRGFDSYGGREAPRSEWEHIREGQRHPCWYDPANPTKAVLSRRFNPHFYWVLALPLSVMVFSGLLLRESLRKTVKPKLKGIEPGRRLNWRLPPVASQQAMTGCLGVAVLLFGVLAAGFCLAALDYEGPVYKYRWISRVLGFHFNGWWIVMLVFAGIALVFLWAFLANLRWVGIPEPTLEVNDTRLRPGQGTRLHLRQGGPIKTAAFTVSLVCEVNAVPGKPPHSQETLLSAPDIDLDGSRAKNSMEFDAEFTIPASARPTRTSIPVTESSGRGTSPTASRTRQMGGDLVSWFLRVERTVARRTVLQSDFEILVVESD